METKNKQISVSMSYGKSAISHDLRTKKYTQQAQKNNRLKNVNLEKVGNNKILKRCSNLEKEFNKIFQSSVNEYNRKQKKEYRKIDNYFEHIQNISKQNKKKTQRTMETDYEYVIQFGNKDYFPPESEQMLENIFNKLDNDPDIKKHFHINYAVIHNDEKTPHMHINITPIAIGYKKGLFKQPGLNKATQQCFNTDGRNFAYENLLEYVKFDLMKTESKNYGYDIADQQQSGKKHLSVEEHEKQQKLNELDLKIESYIDNLEMVIDNLEMAQAELDNTEVEISQNYEMIDRQHKRIVNLDKREKAVKQREQDLKDKETKLNNDKKQNILDAQKVADLIAQLSADREEWEQEKENEKERLKNKKLNFDQREKEIDQREKEINKRDTQTKSEQEASDKDRERLKSLVHDLKTY